MSLWSTGGIIPGEPELDYERPNRYTENAIEWGLKF